MNILKNHDLSLMERHLPSFPWFVDQFIHHKLPDASPSTLLEYLRDYECFFHWLISEGLSPARSIREISLSDLERLHMEQVDAYKMFLALRYPLWVYENDSPVK